MSANTHPSNPSGHRLSLGPALSLFWFFLTAVVALTASLLVLGGIRIVGSPTVRAVLLVSLFALVAHAGRLYRHRGEPISDERLLRARERRGF
jgi:hypothetical protein